MKKKLTGMLLAFAVSVVLFSCKKAAIDPIPSQVPQTVTENLRSWVKAQSAAPAFQKIIINGKTVSVPQFVLLERTQYFPAERINITPVCMGNAQTNTATYKYLATELGEDGKIIKGNFYVILNDIKNKAALAITPELINLNKIPVDFSGTIMKYDLNNNIIFTKHYEKGLPTNKTGKLATKKGNPAENRSSTEPVGNFAPLNPGCEYVHIDWYYQIYENGLLVYEEYIETTTVVVCDESGSGGSGGESPSGAEILDMMFANGAVRSTQQPPITVSQTTTDITQRYPWIIYFIHHSTAFGIGTFEFSFISEEVGTKHLGTDGKWHWVSFTHSGIHKIGFNLGFTSVDCNNVVPVPQIGTGFFSEWASMNLTFDIEISLLYKGLAIDRYEGKNASHVWSINYLSAS